MFVASQPSNVLTFGEQRCSPHREGQIRPGLLLQGTLGCTPLPGPRGPQTQGTRWVGTCCWRGTKDRASRSISLRLFSLPASCSPSSCS